jgi:hypothetical protein
VFTGMATIDSGCIDVAISCVETPFDRMASLRSLSVPDSKRIRIGQHTSSAFESQVPRPIAGMNVNAGGASGLGSNGDKKLLRSSG